MAPRHGFEPRFTAPKAAVLPLDDRGVGGKCWNPFSLTHACRIREGGSGVRRTAVRKPILAGAGPGLQTRHSLPCITGGFDPTGFRQASPSTHRDHKAYGSDPGSVRLRATPAEASLC